jgi:lipid-A-disaccharide synthase-like uncharacterized protein
VTDRAPTPPALTLSVVFGVVGGVALLVAAITGSIPIFVVAFASGTSSLIAALYWRSQLISDWREAHGQSGPPAGIR